MSRYKAYPAYRDSGVEWLGEIPSHWHLSRVKEEADVINGHPFDASKFDPITGIPIVRIRDIFSRSAEVRFNGIAPQNSLINSGDILIGMDGEFNVASWSGGPAALNQRVACIRSSKAKVTRYLYYVLPFRMQVINDLTYFTTVKHLSSVDIEKTKFALPPCNELETIVAFLDHETAKIDALIEKQQRLIELLKEKRQAVISHAVTKGLNPNAPMKDSGVEWLGEVPAHWSISQIRRLVQVRGGFAFNSDLFSEEGIPVIRIGDIKTDGRISLDACKRIYAVDRGYLQYAVRRGDLLMAMTGATIGKAGWYLSDELAYLNQRVGVFKPLNESLLMTYLWYILSSSGYQAYIKLTAFGGAQPNISDTGMVAYYSATPSLSEQGKIVAYLDVVTKKLDDLCRKAESQIALMQERRTALISAAVTGKIDVRDWQASA